MIASHEADLKNFQKHVLSNNNGDKKKKRQKKKKKKTVTFTSSKMTAPLQQRRPPPPEVALRPPPPEVALHPPPPLEEREFTMDSLTSIAIAEACIAIVCKSSNCNESSITITETPGILFSFPASSSSCAFLNALQQDCSSLARTKKTSSKKMSVRACGAQQKLNRHAGANFVMQLHAFIMHAVFGLVRV